MCIYIYICVCISIYIYIFIYIYIYIYIDHGSAAVLHRCRSLYRVKG